MARHESDREDLFAEAAALVRRAELAGAGVYELIVAGFKRDGSFSVYFGGDPVYHFDAEFRLKRAFRAGKLYRTQGDTLAELVRERTATATLLRRRDLASAECETLLFEMQGLLRALSAQINEGQLRIVRHFPHDDAGFVTELASALETAAGNESASASLAPRFRGKR